MWRSVLAFSALALFGAGLTGCALNKFEQREPWRDQTEQACNAKRLVETGEFITQVKAIEGPGVCGMLQPYRVTRMGGGSVALKQRMTLACPALAEAEAWLADTIQPAAALYFGQPVAEINAGTYACRGRNNQVGAKLSEHSFGNALDIMSFKLADGYVITVKGGWRGTEAEQGFLREVFLGACARFSTVLAPGSNVFHYDHIHVDLARHDPRGLRRICQPLIKFTPQLGGESTARPVARPRPVERLPAPPQAPVDVEEDDPYGVTPLSQATPQNRNAPRPAPSHLARAPVEAPSHARSAPSAYVAAPAPRPRLATTRPLDEPAPGFAREPLSLQAPGLSGPIY
ncbi:extensin [Methylobacterium sp. Leaf469]|uniref:extensin-like domain-containing protein n=1 Tax=unclassified Methylobacterium TaxID=2615210 RepID=UPI0006F64812|nr:MULTISPECIES: extensin family protein [unclassified Methylobacterium]KQP28372.1 extensin [Methylobacterium sp. Leaf102]KQP58233.1 extensin [Methylobacterium sp. Leaf112]KQT89967.1 extensin [Methylobacterium sp. Leaf469]